MALPSMFKKGGIRVRLLPSMVGERPELQYANTFLINEKIAIDAGSLGFNGSPDQQAEVREVLLTHSHADHIASLPMLLINDYEPEQRPGRGCIRVWAGAETHASLQEHVFNDEIWPNLERIGTPDAPLVRWGQLEPEVPIELEGLRFTPIPVDHTVPTFAFLIESETVSVVIGGDSGPTTRLWECARKLRNLRAVFLEASFSNDQLELSLAAKHLRPETFAEEVAKMPVGIPFFAVHFKPTRQEQIEKELLELGLPALHIVKPGQEWAF